MGISTEQIKELRERTGVSIMQCKKSLEEASGDMEKAVVLLRKHSKATAQKKAGRELGAGTVASYIHSSKDIGTMVLLSSETDFVAQNKEFVQLAYNIAMHIAATAPLFINRQQVGDADTRAAREVFEEEVKDVPEEQKTKAIAGKMDAFLKEKVLLEQSYIKNPEMTIGNMLEEAVQKFGERIEIAEMARFSVRE
jgi:elongation factor Ts